MKILIVNKFLYPNGGSETYIFGLGKQLQKMGHEVQYFGMEHPGRIVGNHAESYTANMDFHTGKLQKVLYPFKIIYSLEARRKIRLVLQDFKPDVVHLNNINFQLTPSIIYEIRAFEKKQKKTIRLVSTAHDSQWVCPNHLMLIPSNGKRCFACEGGRYGNCIKNRCIHDSKVKSIIAAVEASYYKHRKTYDMVDAVICPSEFIKKRLDTNPLLAEKTIVLHNFVTEAEPDEKTEAAWQKLQPQLPERYVLYFGRFSEEKGVETLVKVCRELPWIPFVFAGSGPLTDAVSATENIQNVGFVEGEALRKLIAGAAFSVYPSECYENCPFSVMESQIYGTPMIASDLGGIPELLQDNVTGELFEAGNREALTKKITKLWEDAETCRKYRENCKDIKFDTIQEYCGKIIEQAYRSKE